MTKKISIALAQMDFVVGDISGNTELIIEASKKAKKKYNADLIVFPELSISGYPPEDLLLHSGFKKRIIEASNKIQQEINGIDALVGYPEYQDEKIFNSCSVFSERKEIVRYRKEALPNYSVFDEKRYFDADDNPAIFSIKGKKIGINICEDIWQERAAIRSKEAGAELIIVINGSPYEKNGQEKREKVVKRLTEVTGLPFVYLNMIGGQDELIFDGSSFVMDKDGEIRYRARSFEESLDLDRKSVGVGKECVNSCRSRWSPYH